MKHSKHIVKLYETLEHSSFNATISMLDAETSAFGAATLAIARRSFDAMWRRRCSAWRCWRSHGVTADIGNCRVGITPQMCNRVTNHGDMSTFSKPDPLGIFLTGTEFLQSSLHSGRSLACHHVRGDIDSPCGTIADFCGVIADPCGVVMIGGLAEAIGSLAVADRCATL